MKLLKENGETAGLFDIIEWFAEKYPQDIFISKPVEIVKVRECMLQIKELSRKNKKKIKKLEEKGLSITEITNILSKNQKREMISLFKWKKYPEETPKDNERSDLIVILKNGKIKSDIFYTIEDSAHNHSIWNEVEYWVRFEDLKPTILKNRIVKEKLSNILSEYSNRNDKSTKLLNNHFYCWGSWDKDKQEFWIYLNPEDNELTGKLIIIINWEISTYRIYEFEKQNKFWSN